MIIGFTGTQLGMTTEQKNSLLLLLRQLNPAEFHHGVCIGSDADAHQMCLENFPALHIFGHPPDQAGKKALLEGFFAQEVPRPYLVRNAAIVDAVDHLIAVPKGFSEELRSGTWSTVRRARAKKVRHTIIFPNGKTLTVG